ncbi:MAG: hypothetical protein WKF94_18395 [Solirubrobacteraceae bacterium]
MLLTGAAKEIAKETFSANTGEWLSLTVAGAVEIPAGAAGADAQVRVACRVDGDIAPVTNLSIVSTRTASAPVTTE